jgi:outer membrane protein OmpA-like peptidoglycan-associated protein
VTFLIGFSVTPSYLLIPRRNFVIAVCLGFLFTSLQAIGGNQSANASYLPNPYTFNDSFNCPANYTNGTPNSYHPNNCANASGTGGVYQGTYINLVDTGTVFATGVSNHDNGIYDSNIGLRPAADTSFTLEAWVKSPDYSTLNAVVLIGASPSYILEREGAMTVGISGIYTIGGQSYTVWYVDTSGFSNIYFAFPTSAMSINTWHWVVVNQDSTNGLELFVDGVPGRPTGAVNSFSAPDSSRFMAGGQNGSNQLYFTQSALNSNTKRRFNGSYQIGAWFGKRVGDQHRDTIGGVSFGDIRYTAPSIYSSAATSLAIPTSAPTALSGTQLLLTSGDTTDGITDESGNQQLQFVNVTTNAAGQAVSGFITGQTQSALNLTTTSANVNTTITLATSGGSGSGSVSFVVNSGPCTVSAGNQLTASSAGTCVVVATKANDGTYNSISVSGNIVISTPPPVVASIPIPSPQQRSEIQSINRITCYVGVPTEFVVTGRFYEVLTNINIDQVNLPINSWRQSESEVAFTFTANELGEFEIQLYNGSVPLLIPQIITAVAKPETAKPETAKPAEPTKPSINTQPSSAMKKITILKFGLGASALTQRQKSALSKLVVSIKESDFQTVLLYGHTDSQPGVDNVMLSKKRAKSVQAFMKPLLPDRKLKVGWFASSKPAVEGDTPAAYSQNRRVEVWVK